MMTATKNRRTKKLDAEVCVEMVNWHRQQAESCERKLHSKLSDGTPCMSGSPQLWEQFEMHRRFHRELSKLHSFVCPSK